jgi:hypothetical protein
MLTIMGRWIIMAAGAAAQVAALWSTCRHDMQRTGQSDVLGPQGPNVVVKWVVNTGPISITLTNTPVIAADSTVYMSDDRGNLTALFPNGTKRWMFAAGRTSSSTPAIASDGTLYFGGWNAPLYALNPNGTQKWSYYYSAWDSPAIGPDGTVYVSYGVGLSALAPNGTELWRVPDISSEPFEPVTLGLDGNILVVCRNGDHLAYLFAVSSRGHVLWNVTINGGAHSGPVVGRDGTIFILSTRLYALRQDGSMRWNLTIETDKGSAPAVAVDGTVYFLSNHDNYGNVVLYALAPNGTVASIFTAVYPTTPIIGGDGTLYLAERIKGEDYLTAIFPNGTIKWRVPAPRQGAPTAIAADGTLYFVAYAGQLYAIADAEDSITV